MRHVSLMSLSTSTCLDKRRRSSIPLFSVTALAMACQAAFAQSAPAGAGTSRTERDTDRIVIAQTAPEGAGAPTAEASAERVEITGSRIKPLSLTSTSPVSQIGGEQIELWRAATVQDFSSKLPQLAGGVSGSTPRSDAFGAQTLDLRGLGQNRTLVLINGTRAIPFSFRNAVDVNFVPATLIERVDVLTGGASAVYGSDAVAGAVNFIMKNRFEGLQAQASLRAPDGGGEQFSVNFTGGLSLGERGSVVGYVEYTDRKALLAGDRPWALLNSASVAGAGGAFRDVASGRTFSIDAAGNLGTTTQNTDYTRQFTLGAPMERFNASSFFRYYLVDEIQAYGRVMLSNVRTEGVPASGPGQQPVVISQSFLINENNPFIPAAARPLLTFVNGSANVNVDKSLASLGVRTARNDRDTWQAQVGLRGPITRVIDWDVYAQTGQSNERITIHGEGRRSSLTNAYVNSINIFSPTTDFSGLAASYLYEERKRTQDVVAGSLSGDSSEWFGLPAGPVGFAVGIERRSEKGSFEIGTDLSQSFNQSAPARPATPPSSKVEEIYAELRVPLLAKLPGAKRLFIEGAFRRSDYSKSVGADTSYSTNKLGLNWEVMDDLALRATRQTALREPNFGEFANPVGSIPFSALVTNPALRPRYQGDPCALGTGNASQCARLAPGLQPYNSLDPALLTGGYFFGGNPEVGAEKGKSLTMGLVFTPSFARGLSATADYYRVTITDAIGVIQPVDALTSCYITDPRADNPLCSAVTRDPITKRIANGLVTDRNLAEIEQQGVDVGLRWRAAAPFGLPGNMLWEYQGSFVTRYTIQRNPVLDPIDCKGTYGSRCSSDSVSLVSPDYRHRASTTWQIGSTTTQLSWRRIGGVRNSAVGGTGTIPAFDYFDLGVSWRSPIKGLTINAGVDNLTDKAPPSPTGAGAFNTFTDTYDVVGRNFGVSVTARF